LVRVFPVCAQSLDERSNQDFANILTKALYFSIVNRDDEVTWHEALLIAKIILHAIPFLLIPMMKSIIYLSSISIEKVKNFISKKSEEIQPFDLNSWELAWMMEFMGDYAKENEAFLPIEDKSIVIRQMRNKLEHKPKIFQGNFQPPVEKIIGAFRIIWNFLGKPTGQACGLAERDITLLMTCIQQVFPLKNIDLHPPDWVTYICSKI